VDEGIERRDGELRRAHEDNAHGGSILSRPFEWTK
jgi:hypothetical protein